MSSGGLATTSAPLTAPGSVAAALLPLMAVVFAGFLVIGLAQFRAQ